METLETSPILQRRICRWSGYWVEIWRTSGCFLGSKMEKEYSRQREQYVQKRKYSICEKLKKGFNLLFNLSWSHRHASSPVCVSSPWQSSRHATKPPISWSTWIPRNHGAKIHLNRMLDFPFPSCSISCLLHHSNGTHIHPDVQVKILRVIPGFSSYFMNMWMSPISATSKTHPIIQSKHLSPFSLHPSWSELLPSLQQSATEDSFGDSWGPWSPFSI